MLLDLNPLAAGHEYFRLGAFEVSPDHRLLAWSADTSGAESFTLYVKELATGALLAETISGVSPSVAWANDSRTLFYVVLDDARRPCRLFRHRLGENPSADALVHFEADESFFLDIGRTRSNAYLLVDLSSHSTTEVRYASADRPEEAFRVIEPRRPGVEYSVTHHGDRFFITTNDGAPNFRLVSAPVSDPSRERWTEVLPHRPDVKVDSTDAFRRHLVVYEREAGLRQIRILALDAPGDAAGHLVEFPEPVYTVRQHENPEFDTTQLRFTYTSMVTPPSVVDYDMTARTWTVRKQTEVLGGYDPARYRSERLFATAPDGTRVPVSLVYQLPARAPRRSAAPAAQRLWRVRGELRSGVLVEQPEPARPRRDRRHRARARGRGDGARLVRGREAPPQAEHVHRFHRGRGAPDRGGLHRARPARDERRERGRAAHGRGRQPAAGPVPRGGGGGAVRGRGEHDARCVAPAHGHRVRRVGEPERRPRRIAASGAIRPTTTSGRRRIRTC